MGVVGKRRAVVLMSLREVAVFEPGCSEVGGDCLWFMVGEPERGHGKCWRRLWHPEWRKNYECFADYE